MRSLSGLRGEASGFAYPDANLDCSDPDRDSDFHN